MSLTILGLSSIPPSPLPLLSNPDRCPTCGRSILRSTTACETSAEFKEIPSQRFCDPGCIPESLLTSIDAARKAVTAKRAATQREIDRNLQAKRDALKVPEVVLLKLHRETLNYKVGSGSHLWTMIRIPRRPLEARCVSALH